METKLFVGNLPYTTTEDELRDLFADSGTPMEANIVLDRETGRSRGFGFVTMATPEEAQKAAENWNGREYDGRKLIVNEALPKQPRGDSGPPNRRPGRGGKDFGRGGDRRR